MHQPLHPKYHQPNCQSNHQFRDQRWPIFKYVMQYLDMMEEDAAANEEHGNGANNSKQADDHGEGGDEEAAEAVGESAFVGAVDDAESNVIETHQQGDDAVDADGGQHGDDADGDDLAGQRLAGDGAEGNDNDLDGEDEVGADGGRDFDFLFGEDRFGGLGGDFSLFVVFAAMEEPLPYLLGTFEAQVESSKHEDRDDEPGGESTEEEGDGEDDEFVQQRALGDRPQDGDLPCSVKTGGFFGVDCEVVPEDSCGVFGRDLGHRGTAIQHRSDIVKEGEQSYGHTVILGRECLPKK